MNVDIRNQFPALKQKIRGHDLCYLDSGATTLKPECVIQAVNDYNSQYSANVHRGTHHLSELATKKFESARESVRKFIGAKNLGEIIFTKGTTESLNLVAHSLGSIALKPGSEILLSGMEHHSNIVPWQIVAERVGAKIIAVPFEKDGSLNLSVLKEKLSPNTVIVGVTHVSNALGTVNDIKAISALAHEHGAYMVVDGAQAIAHVPVDVLELDCDFYAFSGHKMYGPTGVGVLYGKRELLERMPPYQGGGDMIASVSFEKTTYAKLPHKFEAGTPNIAGVIGLGAAVEFIRSIGFDAICRHEQDLIAYAVAKLENIKGLSFVGTASSKVSCVSFTLGAIHPHDVGTIVDGRGVAIRAGHLCAQPVMKLYGVPALCRASFGIYNTREDVDALAEALNRVVEMF